MLDRASYLAYANKDCAAIDKLIADDFHFTSPLDNHIDRATYFARCWPISDNRVRLHPHCADGDRVFVTYEGRSRSGNRFRNSEILTVRDGKIVEAEVYFRLDNPARGSAGWLHQSRKILNGEKAG